MGQCEILEADMELCTDLVSKIKETYKMDFTVELPQIPSTEYCITEYGAVNGGTISNTKAIQKTIDTAYENGGGKVVIPAGIWLTGPIELKSHIELHVETGAVVVFDKKEEEYPLCVSDYEGMEAIRVVSPIHAKNASHIAITGHGTIDGNGQLWRPVKEFKMTAKQWEALLKKSTYVIDTKEGGIWLPTKTSYEGFLLSAENPKILDDMETAKKYWDYYRPVMVRLDHCDHVLIEDITLQNSPAWNVHPLFCEHLTIRHANIRNPYYAQNGDGLDLESCKYAHIHDTTFDVGDDAICMKSGKGAKAREIKVPTEYVSIHDCTVYHGHGGFVVGSEMSRGVRHVEVKNCAFIGTDVGIRFKSALSRGGVVEDIVIEDIQMLDIEKEAIIFTMGYVLDYREEKKTQTVVDAEDIPYFKNVTMRRITCNGAKIGLKVDGIDMNTLDIQGKAEKGANITQLTLEDSMIIAQKETDITNATEVILRNVAFS